MRPHAPYVTASVFPIRRRWSFLISVTPLIVKSYSVIASARRAAAEVVAIVGLVLLIIWVIKPLDIPTLDLSWRVLVGGLIVASGRIHSDSRQRLGLRLDNFGKALMHVLPVSLLAAAVCVAIGVVVRSIHPPRHPVPELLTYLAWAS